MIKKEYFRIFFGALFAIIFAHPALAQTGAEDVAENIVDSSAELPGLVTAFCYLIGLVLGVSAVFKIKDHVDNPNQTPLRVGVVRSLAGGALFATPIVYEAALTTINGGTISLFDIPGLLANDMSAILGGVTALLSGGTNFNALLDNIKVYSDEIPGLISAVAYLLALLLGVLGVLKIKDHVEDPDRTHLKEGVIRLLAAGALLGLQTLYEAMYTTIAGDGVGWAAALSALTGATFLWSSETQSAECVGAALGLGVTLGDTVCNAWINSAALPAFLTGIAYVLGLIFGVWGVLKIRDHVLNPMQVSLWEGLSRLVAGGAFFALPPVVTAMYSTVTPVPLLATIAISNTTFNENPICTDTRSLDQAMACFMDDLLGPGHVALNFFSFVAGMIFIMIGISRLIKSAQEGARGPGGLGTVTTFVTGGLLISATTILRAVSTSLFSSPITSTFANLSYTTGMTATETQAAYNVISAVLKFMIVVGMISFVRGIFIMRDVAEGKQNASTMAGLTHIVGGALAVNLGPLINAVQMTLGITTWGVSFL